MQPLVSVIIPSYNRAHMLPRALKSLFKQSYTNWEALIVDDASTDNTAEVVQQFEAQDSRIHFFKLSKNSGACVARNVGIENAKGEYVTFLDSDDEYFPSKIEKQVQCFATSTIENIGIVSCGREDARDGVVYLKWIPTIRGNIVKNLLQKDRVGANTSFLMVKSELLKKHHILFDPQMPAGQDWDFLVRVCLHAGFDFVPEPLVTIHHHSGERVYTGERSLIAFERQYEKNKQLLLQDTQVHDKFLMKMVSQNYVYGHGDKAINILETRLKNKSLKTTLWTLGIKAFPKYGTMPSKVVYKMLQLLA